jgi:hypothetical protein
MWFLGTTLSSSGAARKPTIASGAPPKASLCSVETAFFAKTHLVVWLAMQKHPHWPLCISFEMTLGEGSAEGQG